MPNDIFPILILNARPAAGKSELRRALMDIPVETRISRFHIGPMHVIDDFPMVWSWFEEDQLLEQIFNRPRLYTTPDEYFLHPDLWHLLIRRLCLDYKKWLRDAAEPHTVVFEFSRGVEHGGYRAAYQHLSEQVLDWAASLYIKVSYQESVRKNLLRFNPDRPDSILQHSLDSGKLERLYQDDDWEAFTKDDPDYIQVNNHRVPYGVFENEDDVTTSAGKAMFDRLEECLGRLWALKHPQGAV
jgi:hypothetical protein